MIEKTDKDLFFDTKVVNVQSASELDSIYSKPKAINIRPKETGATTVALWGDGNDFPQQVIEDVNKDPEIKPMLRKSAELLYGGGVTFFKYGIDETTGKEVKQAVDPNKAATIRNWMRRSNFNRYLKEASIDLYYFANVFPELVLNVGKSEIVQIAVRAAETCRYQRMNKNGVIENLFVSYNWPAAKPDDEYTKTIPVLDPYYSPAEQLKNGKGTNYIFPLSEPSPGNNYYQLTDWNAIRTSGWLHFSQEIPKYKTNIIKNQFGVRFVVEVNTKYFEWRFPGFNSKPETERTSIVEAERKKWENFCTGTDSVGKVITINFVGDGQNKDITMVKFSPLRNVIEKNEYIEDGTQASAMKAFAMNLHPAIIGSLPNSGLGGAGSNIREAYNLHVILIKSKQDLLLEPLYCVRDFNGWGEDIEFEFNNTLMTTLDTGKETKPLNNGTATK